MSRFTAIVLTLSLLGTSSAFTAHLNPSFSTKLSASKESGDVVQQRAYAVGTLIEFTEKKRVHVGKIASVDHKSNGGARYDVEDHDGHKSNIADKAVNYAMPISPNDERKIKQLFDEFAAALEEPEMELRTDLDISAELLEMAWEETLEDESQQLTPKSLVDLVHSHTASAIESYKAWRLMRTDMAHVFFKELKEHGRVVAFKAKAKKAVDAAKITFCRNPDHSEDDVCWV